MKIQKVKILSCAGLLLIIFIAFLNHLLTFLAYEWFPGGDSYSYDISGLQLVSGRIFDIFPLIFRPPLVPIFKNIFYLIFEGHPYLLFSIIHILGIFTVFLAYLLGKEFNKLTGFIFGLVISLNLEISVFFHSISLFTFYVPLLLLSLYFFVKWIKNYSIYNLIWLILFVFLCCITRTETLILIPLFGLLGWVVHKNWKQSLAFIFVNVVLYNIVCLGYYVNLGYWGTTHKIGRSLFNRVTRAPDQQFDFDNGPASRQVYRYMSYWVPKEISLEELGKSKLLTYVENKNRQKKYLRKLGISEDTTLIYRQMFTLNMAQQNIGHIEADKLFKNASLEAIYSDPMRFFKFSLLRMCAHLGLCKANGLDHDEYLLERAKFLHKRVDNPLSKEEIKEDIHWHKRAWRSSPYDVSSPFSWQKDAMIVRLRRIFGQYNKYLELPDSFRKKPNYTYSEDGLSPLYLAGFGAMTERLWNCCDLDVYYFLIYWGPRWTSKTALRILKYWDIFFIPNKGISIYITRIVWIFFITGIFVSRKRWYFSILLALLCIILFQAFVQSIFSDNLGGRFALYMRPYLWLGGIVGFLASVKYCYKKYKEYELN